MRKKIFALALMLIMLVAPLVARWLYHYRDPFEPRAVPRPDLDAIQEPTPELSTFVDRRPALSPGVILVDMAHENRFDMSELGVLRARLSARGQWLEPVERSGDLAERLRYAKALVVISPGRAFDADEIQLVKNFVDKGGRLLLVTDPTRFGVRFDAYGNVLGLDSDVMHVNDLAAQFGLVFQSDYLYNTVENEGNYRNIQLTELAQHPLTAELERLAFYATHSIESQELALVSASGETRSSDSEQAGGLDVAVLAAEGAVLALGDLTFMIEPHNLVYGNEQFIANVADFLGGAQRRYELAEFPFFFDDQVDLIYAGAPTLDSDILRAGAALQTLFDRHDKLLTVHETEQPTRDTLFLGLYAYTEEVESYLDAAGVSLVFTSTAMLEPEASVPSPTPSASPNLTVTVPITAVQSPTTTLSVSPTLPVSPTAILSSTRLYRVEIASLGPMVVTGTSLSLLQRYDGRDVLVVLANTQVGLESAVRRLTAGDLEGCMLRESLTPPATSLALCPTGEVAVGEGSGGWQDPDLGPRPTPTPLVIPTPLPLEPVPTESGEPTPTPGEPEGRIIVVAFDDGEGRYEGRTSAPDYAEILRDRFEVQVWRLSQDGLPDPATLLEFDLVIWTTGDFEGAIGEEESGLLVPVLFDGKPVLISGAFLDETGETAVQRDIQVQDASHPLTRGFGAEEIVSFVTLPSGQVYETNVLETELTDDVSAVFVRGPDSEESGEVSVAVAEDEVLEMRVTFIGFPLYLLPQEAKSRLVLNAVDWMLGE